MDVVLNWATGKSEAHKLDEKLSTITVRSGDGFKFNLDVSQIIHIPRNDAPKVIARFGSMLSLVTQVLEPTIGNYFRNAAQGSDVIQFLKSRTARQQEARQAIAAALSEYNVGAVDTLIGDISPPEELMKTLTSRKIAEQEQITYETQRQAEVVRKELEQAKAQAATQANVIQLLGAAEAGKILQIGTSEATVIKQKADAITADSYVSIEVAKALASSGKLVPDIMASGGAGSSSTLVEMLMASIVKDSIKKPLDKSAQL